AAAVFASRHRACANDGTADGHPRQRKRRRCRRRGRACVRSQRRCDACRSARSVPRERGARGTSGRRMMLAWKSWRESRARFLLSAAALAWFCSAFVLLRPMIQYAPRRTFTQFVVDAIYAGSVRNIFVLFIIAIGMGGLAQEATRGSAPMTLAL